jgi:cysteine desulfurase family protein (TIGR01976 family)
MTYRPQTRYENNSTTFPLSHVRSCFPSLDVTDDGRRRIYLDNPAGTQVPVQVIDAVTKIYLEHNTYTGVFDSYSVEIDELVSRAYDAMACFMGTSDRGEIIIGPNTTSLAFLLTRCLAHQFNPGDEIIVTHMDHEGNISPWLKLAEDTGATIRWLGFRRDSWRVEPDDLSALLNDKTKLVALNYVSNLTGAINDIAALTRLAKSAGALVFVDGVQFAPHYLVDAPALGCDFFAVSPYKFFGPHLGTIWGRRSVLESCRSYKVRTASDDLPQRFMVGVPPFELLSGLLGMVRYFETLGRWTGDSGDGRSLIASAYCSVKEHETRLAKVLLGELSDIRDLSLLGPTSDSDIDARAPIFSFNHKRNALGKIVNLLTAHGIFCHWGRKFANEAANFLGTLPADGFLRIGVSHYSTMSEVDEFIRCVRTAISR